MPTTIRNGATGQEVREAQYLLARRRLLDATDIDGVFGPKTEATVRGFQTGEGLVSDGVIGPLTWAALLTGYAIPPALANGSSGDIVRRLQAFLNQIGPDFTPPASPIAVDGSYGPATTEMVKGFQRWSENGIGVDGIVGLRTWAAPLHAAGQQLAGEIGV